MKNKLNRKRRRKAYFPAKWYKKTDGGYIMDEAPRTVFGTIRKIRDEFWVPDYTSDSKESNNKK